MADGPTVVVGHGTAEMSQQVGEILLSEGFSPLHASDGDQVLRIVDDRLPKALVLDVALGGVPAFQVIDRVKNGERTSNVKVILIASVYTKTAYKRRPSSLYGADDYVEQHHIPDKLPAKLGGLLGVSVTPLPPALFERVKVHVRDAAAPR